MNVPQHVRQQVVDRIIKCMDIAEQAYGRKFDLPTISYDLKGATAGTANSRTNHIQINPVLLMQELDNGFIEDTVTHEFAHLVDAIVYPETRETNVVYRRGRYVRTKRSVHGPTWKSVMRVLGVEPSRCHTYDTSTVKRKKTQFEYVCNCCGDVMKLGPKAIKKHLILTRYPDGIGYFLRSCKAKGCKLQYTAKGVIPPKQPAQKLVEVTMREAFPKKETNAGKSKKDQAKDLYLQHKHEGRSAVIAVFMSQLNMTKAGASTYYYNIVKENQ